MSGNLDRKKISEENGSAFAVKSLVEEKRHQSSSGGVFYLIAEEIINKGGIVYGAAFDEDFQVVHTGIERIENLPEIMGSKYVQSNIGGIFAEIKQSLEEGREVLFSGTPCQSAGLKKFLVKNYENLTIATVACHGTPSTKVWKKYIQEKENEYHAALSYVNFRDKRTGWKSYSITFGFNNGKEYSSAFSSDPYMLSFLMNYSLRSSCYQCNFKGQNLVGDIVLADFWGIEEIVPEMDDDKGTSLVLIKTEKGKRLLEAINLNIEIQEVPAVEAIKRNGGLLESAKKPEKLDKFWKELEQGSIEDSLKVATHRSFMQKFVGRIKRIIK